MDECQNVITLDDLDSIDIEDVKDDNMGQTESKKISKRGGTPETKGTAMSFGFKKKLLPSNKKTGVKNGAKEKETETLVQETATVYSNPNCLESELKYNGDDNGNTAEHLEADDRGTTGRSTPTVVAPKKESSGAPYRSTRFGFRKANIIRPASTGLPLKVTNFDNITNNNITNGNAAAKPRSKSATNANRSPQSGVGNENIRQQQPSSVKTTAITSVVTNPSIKKVNTKIDATPIKVTTTTTPVINNHSQNNVNSHRKITFEVQSNASGSNINKPPNGRVSYAVINTELHTNEIVRPTAHKAIVSKFTLHTSSLPKPQQAVPISITPHYAMDTKVAKQAANTTTKRGFQATQREISTDSGISSISTNDNGRISPSKMRTRPRNLEMVMNGRHRFQVRDLDDSLSDDSVVPLPLPELPRAHNLSHQPVNITGLVRNEYPQRNATTPRSFNYGAGAEITHMHESMESENADEEKVRRDNSTSEKMKYAFLANSYIDIAKGNESMASKDFSCASITDSANGTQGNIPHEDDISAVTITADNIPSLSSSLTMPSASKLIHQKSEDEVEDIDNTLNDVENIKYAAITAAVGDVLLDDETSPSNSLMSSTTSDGAEYKKAKMKMNDSIKEKDIDDISPSFDLASPVSHGTPTHASHSFSLSDGDGGRDFLIDDEIADQPDLCFGDDHDPKSSSQRLHSIADTPTLMENGSIKSNQNHIRINSNNNSYAPQAKPRQSVITRTESLDTLSPCESICSDDLMIDFECNSSIDSIDRISRSNHSGSGTGINTADDKQLWPDLETKTNVTFKEWSSLLNTSRNNSRDNIMAQLPARASRLLNRSRINQGAISNAGSESPRSIDSFGNRRSSSRPSSQYGFEAVTCSPDDHLFMLDKTLRNSMIQDVLYCKQQLLQLRSILQDEEECLTRPDSLNPFEMTNGKFFNTSGGYDQLLASLDAKDRDNYSPSLSDDPKHDLVDLRRQVVYLQSQLDDKDRTIRIQQNLIQKLEAEVDRAHNGIEIQSTDQTVETVSMATQTERLRPLSINHDGSISKLDDDDMASVHSLATTASSSSCDIPMHHIRHRKESSSSVENLIPSVKATSIGNNYKNYMDSTTTRKSQSPTSKSTPSTPVARRIPRLVKSPTVDDRRNHNTGTINGTTNGKYISNITQNGGVGDQPKTDENHLNGLMRPSNKSVKLLNDINVFKTNSFAMPIKKNDY